jgi:hypothetical protein
MKRIAVLPEKAISIQPPAHSPYSVLLRTKSFLLKAVFRIEHSDKNLKALTLSHFSHSLLTFRTAGPCRGPNQKEYRISNTEHQMSKDKKS